MFLRGFSLPQTQSYGNNRRFRLLVVSLPLSTESSKHRLPAFVLLLLTTESDEIVSLQQVLRFMVEP